MSQLLTGNSALGVRDLAENTPEVPEGSMGTSDISQLSVGIERKSGVHVLLAKHNFYLFFFCTHCDAHSCLLASAHFQNL